MKKRILSLLAIGMLSFGLTGCGETVINSNGEEVQKFGPYIEISHENGEHNNGSFVTFYKVYNKDTKELFEITDGYNLFSIRQIWDYDEEGHPIVKYYEGE